jgi:hypothetical protein
MSVSVSIDSSGLFQAGISYLELVLASLSCWGWVEEINCENLVKRSY